MGGSSGGHMFVPANILKGLVGYSMTNTNCRAYSIKTPDDGR
jgi:hypothetical protein